MHYEFHLLFVMVAMGLMARRMTWKLWYGVIMLVITWILYCWLKK